MSQDAGSSEKVPTLIPLYWIGICYVGIKTFKHVDFVSTFWTSACIAKPKSLCKSGVKKLDVQLVINTLGSLKLWQKSQPQLLDSKMLTIKIYKHASETCLKPLCSDFYL